MTAISSASTVDRSRQQRDGSGWPGVVALMIAIFALVTSEFLPASLLPLMADDFGITEGVAGQVVTATALVGMVAGLVVALVFPRLDRKHLVVGLLLVALLSNVLSAMAPSYTVVVVARLALGVAIAGTWAMALAIAKQLVGARHLGRAMAVVNIGVAGATVAAVPLGAYVSSVAGWRSVFLAISAVTALALVIFAVATPSMPAAAGGGIRTLVATVRSPVMVVGLIGLAFMIAGHFASYTFVRTAAEGVPGFAPTDIALLLAVFGIGGLGGNLLAGLSVDRLLIPVVIVVPVIIGLSIIAFSLWSNSAALVFVVTALWGAGFGAIPTMSQTWLSRAEPDRTEAAGGLFVATFQLAIALGAALGGMLLDRAGIDTVFQVSGVVVLVGGALLSSTRSGLVNPRARLS